MASFSALALTTVPPGSAASAAVVADDSVAVVRALSLLPPAAGPMFAEPEVELAEVDELSVLDDDLLVVYTRAAWRWCAVWCGAALAEAANAAPLIAREHASRLPSRLIIAV